MDSEPHTDDEFNSDATTDNLDSASYGGAIFSGSQNFAVYGGTFTSVTKNCMTAPEEPCDIRRIALGDIDLQHEICLDNHSGVVNRRRCAWGSIRRVHSAKIDGGKSSVTVAMYQGDGAEEEWRRDIAKYMSVRHPNIIQICGTARSGNIQATIFHDDLIPFQQFLGLYRHLPLLTVYIHGYCHTEFEAAQDYFQSAFQSSLWYHECTILIRRSTGRLCADLTPSRNMDYWHVQVDEISGPQDIKSLDAPNQEAMAIDSLTLDQYHKICYWDLKQNRNISISTAVTVNLGAAIHCSSGHQFEDLVEIASLPNVELENHIRHWHTSRGQDGDVMEDGWTRFTSSDVTNTIISLPVRSFRPESWLSQANHIFSRLQITNNLEDYVVLNAILFYLPISATSVDPPNGFLFLCPPKDLQTGPSSFRWPDCPAYWSLNPSGAERLSTEDAANLGFPSIQLSMQIYGSSWDASVYAGLCQFHQAKGFDPDSQDLTRHLGYPLYQLSSEMNVPLAHIDDAGCDQGRVTVNDESENTQQTSGGNPGVDQAPEHSDVPEEMPVSQTFKFLMNLQLTLILFLILSGLYDQV